MNGHNKQLLGQLASDSLTPEEQLLLTGRVRCLARREQLELNVFSLVVSS